MEHDKSQPGPRSSDDAIDAIIRHRFRFCDTMPLFPQPQTKFPGFFDSTATGRQLHMFERREVRPIE